MYSRSGSEWAGRAVRRVLLNAGCFMLASSPVLAQAPAAKTDLLHQWSESTEVLVKKVAPCVVQVLATGYGAVTEAGQGGTGLVVGRQRAIGSGVIIDPDGYIVTNAHVVSGSQRVRVVMSLPGEDTSKLASVLSARGHTVEARVIGVSPELDLALLKAEVTGLAALPISKYSNLRQGELVFAFGSPEGLRNSVTMGVVSSIARQPDPDSPQIYIQTDAPINPGNSGGPLVNADGELVGVNTFIVSQSGGNEGLGFAIPSGVVRFAYPQLKKYGHVHRGEIGLQVQTVTPVLAAGLGLARDAGVIVSDVIPGGPAAAAGIKIQDIVLSVDGRPIDSLPIFGFSLITRSPGENARMEVLRGSQTLSLEVPVIERPHNVDRLSDFVDPEKDLVPLLGILAIGIDARIAKMVEGLREPSGVIVVARAAGTGWADNSLTTGDVIHALNGSPVTTLEGLRSALQHIEPDSPVVLQVERDQRLMYLPLQME